MVYLIYGKHKGQKKFKAMDMNRGVQVDDLIYATMYYPEMKDTIEHELQTLMKEEPDWTFELRAK